VGSTRTLGMEWPYCEVTSIRSMLLRNAYPSWILDRIIKRSVAQFVQPNVTTGPKKKPLYIGLSFLGSVSDKLRRSIKQINKKFFSKLVVVYQTFFALRIVHHLSCDRMSFINLRARAARLDIWGRLPAIYVIGSQSILVYHTWRAMWWKLRSIVTFGPIVHSVPWASVPHASLKF